MLSLKSGLAQLDTRTQRITEFVRNTNKAGKQNLASPVYLTARLSLLEKYWEALDEQFAAVQVSAVENNVVDADVPYFAEDHYGTAEMAYIEAQAWLQENLTRAMGAADAPNAANAQQPGQHPQAAAVRMKPIETPSFSGDITEWCGFRDLFRAVVTDNMQLTNAQRLQYLRTACKGDAGVLIRDIGITDANFEVAWNALVKRYDNPRVVASKLLEKLLKLPAMCIDSAQDMKQLLDGTNCAVRSLRALGRPTDTWDDILVALTVSKLDEKTRYEWEKIIAPTAEPPTFERLEEFLSSQLRTLEALPVMLSSTREKQLKPKSIHAHLAESKTTVCQVCSEAHTLYNCKRFASMSVAERKAVVVKNSLCFNCLATARHNSRQCTSTYSCKKCSRKHHTLLHINDEGASTSTSAQVMSNAANVATPEGQVHAIDDASSGTSAPGQVVSNVVSTAASVGQVLLGTARVMLHGADGSSMTVRALIDNGSQASFISEHVVKKMGLRRATMEADIYGVGASKNGTSRNRVEVAMSSTKNEHRIEVGPLILKRVTGKLPLPDKWAESIPLFNGLEWADTSKEDEAIELLLGADVYPEIMLDETRRPADRKIMAQRTVFGWIIIGNMTETAAVTRVSVHHLLLEDHLRRFWEQEEPCDSHSATNEDIVCEQIFYEGVRREMDGRFTLRLPFRSTSLELGDSRGNAERRLIQMERRFVKDPDMQRQYIAFMKAYRDLGHMALVSEEDDSSGGYYLPHHAVLKPSSTSTKLRVVFDASMPSSSGASLNDTLMVGPRLQEELVNILMRWRTFRIAITADVEKMFRQVWIAPEDRKYQRILWREAANEKICEYNLHTITYGTACAPYLAVKAMIHLAEEERQSYPLAATVVQRDFYMDDCLTGADDLEHAITLTNELRALMASGGMTLLKWASNSLQLIDALPVEQRELGAEQSIGVDDNIKTLGVRWYPAMDEFGFIVTLTDGPVTSKRAMLSEIARIFDPLSMLAPVIIYAKVLMQMLWLHGTDWDALLPDEIAEKWSQFRGELQQLSQIRVPRWCGMRSADQWTLHAFCDASKTAYAACVYTRVVTIDHKVRVQLLAAKTRVAPLKQQTIPRLELNGAVLLVRLLRNVCKALQIQPYQTIAWTDSTVVLAWIHGQSHRWPTFVANRVAEIHESTHIKQWRHVPGVDNPADVASRGILPAELKAHELWWTGPRWLQDEEDNWPKNDARMVDAALLEEKKTINVNTSATVEMWNLVERYSSLGKLTRVTAYCRRAFTKGVDRSGPLRAEELLAALMYWVGQAQRMAFADELQQLEKAPQVCRASKLLQLHPFIDQHGLLRVGGRLDRARLPYDERHPLILPHRGALVQLIIVDAHNRAFHAGPKQTSAQLQQRFWILGARNAVKTIIHRCVICHRFRPTREHQLMGVLPAARVTPHRAFLHTAVDYAGPVRTRTAKGRGHQAQKAWIAVFVCLSSKATHLELVSDMTTQAFVAAFKRFTARRGHCSDMYADNGTNFVGADREMRNQVHSCTQDPQWSALLADSGTAFHFAPPGAPHFNGLAEAAVKIAKSALQKVIGEHTLTFEEMATLLAQIEAVMNSRPLGPLTRDKDDTSALTPGHLLIGQPLTAVPEPSLLDIKDGRLSRWQLVTKMMQHFWARWRREYLHHLQQRGKWNEVRRPVRIGDIVFILEENTPPTKWPLGRVTKTHPGADGIVRVVTLKTATSELKRAITKISILPIANN